MKINPALVLLACLIVTGVALAADGPDSDAAAINRFFADILLVVTNLKALIEPIVGLAVAAMVAMQYVTMRRQKASKNERAEQSTTLAAQNDQLAHIAAQVETVKAAVAAPDSSKEPTP